MKSSPAIRALMDVAIAEHLKAYLDPAQVELSKSIMGLDTQLIADRTYFLVEEEGRLAGCGGWSRRATLYGGDHSTSQRNAALLDIAKELEEAARIDGCSRLKTLTHVLLPLTGPAVATLAIFTFTASWNEFFWPLLVVQSTEMWTIQLLIAQLKAAEATDWGMVMAIVSLSVLPTVLIYVMLQRYFVKGIAMSGLKG